MSLLILHRTGDDLLALSGTLIERQAFTTLHDADTLLAHASAEAERRLDEASEQAQAQRAEAYALGLANGQSDGLVAVLGTLEVERRMRELLALRLADVVEQCVRKVLGDIGPVEVFQRRVQHLLQRSGVGTAGGAGGRATLHVCPAQAHLAHAVLADLAVLNGAELNWLNVHSDEQCERDALLLETRVGFVDASIHITLAQARDIIQRAVNRAASQLVGSGGSGGPPVGAAQGHADV